MNASKHALALGLFLLTGLASGAAEAQVYRYHYPHAHAQSTPGYAVRNPYQLRQYYHAGRSAFHYGSAAGTMYGAIRSSRLRPHVGHQMNQGYNSMVNAYYYRQMRRSYRPPRSPWD